MAATARVEPYVQLLGAREFVALLEGARKAGQRHFPVADIEVVGDASVSPVEFVEGLTLERVYFLDRVSLRNCRFKGDVRFRSCHFDKGIDFSHSHFDGDLSIAQCELGIEGLGIDQVRLSLEDVIVQGDLDINRTNVNGCVDASRIRLDGDLVLGNCTIRADSLSRPSAFDLGNARVGGSVYFESLHKAAIGTDDPKQIFQGLTGRQNPGLFRTMIADVGTARPTAVSLGAAIVTGDILLSSARFVGEINLLSVQCHGLFCGGGTHRCRDDEFVQWPEDRTNFQTATIEGNLVLSGANLGLVRLEGLQLSGSLDMIDGNSGQIEIEDCVFENTDAGQMFIIPANAGGLTMSAWTCRDFVRVHFSRIGGISHWGSVGVELQSCTFAASLSFWPGRSAHMALRNRMLGESSAPLLIFTRQGVDGPLKNVTDGTEFGGFANRWKRSLTISGQLSIKQCEIKGDLRLACVDIVPHEVGTQGRLDCVDSIVKGEVQFLSPVSYLSDPMGDDRLMRLLSESFVVGAMPATRAIGEPLLDIDIPFDGARCCVVDMRRLSASALDLSGLKIREPTDGRPFGEARIDLDYATIGRQLQTFARLDGSTCAKAWKDFQLVMADENPAASALNPKSASRRASHRDLLTLCISEALVTPIRAKLFEKDGKAVDPPGGISIGAYARVPGALDLQHAVVDGELRVCSVSFTAASRAARAADVGIVLDFSQLRKLSIGRGSAALEGDPSGNGFPIPISLLGMSASAWFLEHGQAIHEHAPLNTETSHADVFLDLLDNDQFRASTYRMIEKSLRDRGLDEEAKRIFVASRFRDVRTGIRTATTFGWSLRPNRWRPGTGRYKGDNKLFFRLRRPVSDLNSVAICMVWLGVVLFTSARVVASPTDLFAWGLLAVALYAAAYPLRFPMREFADRLYWSLLDYGTSATRLATLVLTLFFLSFVFVSGDPKNFEPTLRASIVENTRPASVGYSEDRSWGFGERLWMTLSYHVPLVSVVVLDEWQPANAPLQLAGIGELKQGESPRWWRSLSNLVPDAWPLALNGWPKARDWFGMMQWVNWGLWPLFLPFILRKLRREP